MAKFPTSLDDNSVKAYFYDSIKESYEGEIFKYDQLIEIFWEANDEEEYRKLIVQKEEFLRQIEIEAIEVFLSYKEDLNDRKLQGRERCNCCR